MAAFLRVINALENIRATIELVEESWSSKNQKKSLIERATHETDDAIAVLRGAGLHPYAVTRLEEAKNLLVRRDARKAIKLLEEAKALIVEVP